MSEADTQPAFTASDPTCSAWVAANAGSGKTYVLVTRLVRLMLSGVAPEKLLCLTYTRSAAAEMQDRLFTLLAQWALLDDAALHKEIGQRLGTPDDQHDLALARMLFARALETPGGLRVQTIHSFCESLLKRFPLEAGLSPQFDLLDEHEANDIQTRIVRRLFVRHGDAALRGALDALTRQISEPDLDKLARSILAQRDKFSPAEETKTLTALRDNLGLGGLQEAARAPDVVAAAHMQAHVDGAKALANWLGEAEQVTNQKRGQDLARFIEAMSKQKWEAAWSALSDVFLTQNGTARSSLVTKTYANDTPALASRLQEWATGFEAAYEQYRAAHSYQMTRALHVFAGHLLRDYAAMKEQRGVLDYDDLISCTNKMLAQNRAAAWVLFKIDSGLEHILVDEAQDTSPAQWRVIRALADEFFAGQTANPKPRTIFAVGDEKQSIFSFQGADPAGFDAQYRHFDKLLADIGGAVRYVPLLMSWRSAPQILSLVDQVFGSQDAARGLSASGDSVKHTAKRDTAHGYVALWEAESTGAAPERVAAGSLPTMDLPETSRQKLARRIADKIQSWKLDPSCDIRPGDILILVRKRDAFVDDMIRALKRREIQVAGADRMVLLEQIAIMDLMAAAEFALNPEDDLSLACFLRSPLGGLDEEQLFELAHGRTASLWAALVEAAKTSQNEVLIAAHQRLSWLLENIDYLRPYNYFAELLSTQNGQALLRSRLGHEIDDAIGEFLRLALAFESRHVTSMQGFLNFLRQGEQAIKRDMESRQNAVRIMTVHGAKGLEAPIVFLPDTCSRPTGGAQQRGVLQLAGGTKPLWRARRTMREAFGTQQEERAEQGEQDEAKRLLYVAMTRARDRLYIGGYLNRGASSAPDGSWYQMIANTLCDDEREAEEDGRKLWHLGEEAAAMPERAEPDKPVIEPGPAPDWVAQKISTEAARADVQAEKIFAPSAMGVRQRQGEAAIGDHHEALLVGTLSHALFEHLPAMPEARQHQAASDYLARHGQIVPEAMRTKIVEDVLAVLGDATMARLFAPDSRAEAPIAGFLTRHDGERMQFNGQIDRYVETPEMIYLVDFKTGQVPDSDSIPEAYLLQMAVYQALMQAARPGKMVQCGLVWTQACRVDWLPAAALQAARDAMLSRK
ncbi:double-strand break repair helicase AddA [Alphaproteobacteria bacterium]|nr:double-strand break repair helicase AddA [Alphaproteobacteria bacterium]